MWARLDRRCRSPALCVNIAPTKKYSGRTGTVEDSVVGLHRGGPGINRSTCVLHAESRTAGEVTVRVLVVEQDPGAKEGLTFYLRRRGYDVEPVATGAEALDAHERADLVLLELDLPDLDGLEVCRTIRAASDTPIIAVTSRGTELDTVLGLQAGSDDYLVKPYGFSELVARIEAVMRRVRRNKTDTKPIEYGSLRVLPATREVWVNGRRVRLTRKEFDLLYLLASRPEAVVSRKQIMTDVWNYEKVNSSRTIDTHVSSLRNKLGSSRWIVTVRGVGFRLGRC